MSTFFCIRYANGGRLCEMQCPSCDGAMRPSESEEQPNAAGQGALAGARVDSVGTQVPAPAAPSEKEQPTPRTNAIGSKPFNPQDVDDVMRAMREWATFARELERQLAEARRT